MTLTQVRDVVHCSARSNVPSLRSCSLAAVADTGRDPLGDDGGGGRIVESRAGIQLIWASPRELLNIFHADSIGCHVITVTNDILKKLSLVDKNLDDYSLETVKMFDYA